MGETSYEILVQKGGRWEIDKRYGRMGRRSAVERAKSLEGTGGVTSVKVVKEETDDMGDIQETTIFNSSGGGGRGSAGAAAGPMPAPGRNSGGAPKKSPPKTKKKNEKTKARSEAEQAVRAERRETFRNVEKQAFATIGKVIAITLTGMIGAVALTWALSSLINNIDLNTLSKRSPELANLLGGQQRPTLLIGVFILTFLIIALPFVIRIMRRAAHAARARKAEEFGTKMLDQVLEENAEERGTKLKSTGASAADIMEMTKGQAAENSDGDDADSTAETTPEPGVETKEDDTNLSPEEKKKKQDDDNEIEVRGLPPLAQQARARFVQFFGASLQEVKNAEVPLHANNRLGSCLYLAGACEILGRDHDLDPHFVQVMVTETVRLLGIEGDQALDFGKNYQGYLLNNPQYLDMFNQGRDAMTLYLSGEDAPKARKGLLRALEGWGDFDIPEGESIPVTILVSDVPGTTLMAAQQGQVHVDDILQVQDRVVGDALARWGGREVQRTPTSIVVAFSKAEQGVEAATQIQMSVVEHNHEKKHLQVPLRIGIHSALSVADDPSPLSAAAQLAARITEKTNAAQVLVSTGTLNECVGKRFHFGERGTVELRDIENPVTLHELLWNREMEVREDTLTPEEREARIAVHANAIEEAAANQEQAEGAAPAADGTQSPASPAATAADPAMPTPTPPQPAKADPAPSPATEPSKPVDKNV